MSHQMKQITPFVLCSDLERQIAFYTEVLGFELGFQAENYAFLRCGEVALRLLECPPREDGLTLGHNHSFYIDVADVDELYAQMLPQLKGLAPERLRAPFDQHYGQREFHVLDEDGAMILFGAPLTN